MNTGVSPPTILPKENLVARKHASFSPVGDGLFAKPPTINSSEDFSVALEKYVNRFPEFTFEKIAQPDFGNDKSVARVTGFPVNKPDFINDYFFISLMRNIDYIIKSEYKGQINMEYDTPKPSS